MSVLNMSTRDVPHSHRPVTTGEGFYARHSTLAAKTLGSQEQFFKEKTGEIQFDGKSCFVICNYGAADSGPEASTYKAVIEEIRRIHNRVVPVELIIEDQATNDWETVFKLHKGLMPSLHSAVSDIPNVYLYGSGTGFYDGVCPPGKVHLGMAAHCTHWLSKKPCDLPDDVFSIVAAESEAKTMFKNQAREDWEAFLLQRSAELAPGGYFISVQFALDEDTQSGSYSYMSYVILNNTWKQMMKEGVITQDEFISTTNLDWIRSIKEMKAPFEEENSAVSKSGLKLKEIHRLFDRNQLHESMSNAAYAALYTGNDRKWSESTFYDGLSNARSKKEKEIIVDKFYNKVRETVEANPALYKAHRNVTVAVFAKDYSIPRVTESTLQKFFNFCGL